MRNQGTILGVAISLLVISVVLLYVTYVYAPSVKTKIENEERSKYVNYKVLFVTAEDGLSAGTLITEDMFNNGDIAIKELPKENIPSSLINKNGDNVEYNRNYLVFYVTDNDSPELLKAKVLNKVLTTKLLCGSMIPISALQDDEVIKVDHSKREMEIDVENSSGELLKQGKYVDIIVKYLNGEYDIVIPKILVKKVALKDTEDTSSNENSSQVTIQVAVNEREYRDIELAKRFGDMSIRIYSDNNQYAAMQTFNYDEKIAIVNEIINKEIEEQNVVGAHDKFYKEVSLKIDGTKKDIVIDTENYIKLQEYSDLYANKIQRLIQDKKIVESKPVQEYILYMAIKKLLIKSNVNVESLGYSEILNYSFQTEFEREEVIRLMAEFTQAEIKEAIIQSAKEKLRAYSRGELSKFASTYDLVEITKVLAKDSSENAVASALTSVADTKKLAMYYYKVDSYEEFERSIIDAYTSKTISLYELSYITKLENIDLLIALLLGNKYVNNDEGLNRAQLYEKYSVNYKSSLDTRRLVADSIVDNAILFYQTYNKIDSIAYLIRNDLYYQYIK